MRPVGLGDELRAALVVGGHCWGYMCLHREDGAVGFTAAEADLLRRLAPHIAHALRQAVLLHRRGARGAHRPGVVVLDEQMELVASTPEADVLLPLIGHGSTRLPLPAGVYSVAAALATADQPPSLRVRAATGGWLSLHASRLASPTDTRIAVVVEPAEPQSTLGVLLAAYGLTPRELDIARHRAARRLHQDHRERAAHLRAHRAGPPQVRVRQDRRAQPSRPRRAPSRRRVAIKAPSIRCIVATRYRREQPAVRGPRKHIPARRRRAPSRGGVEATCLDLRRAACRRQRLRRLRPQTPTSTATGSDSSRCSNWRSNPPRRPLSNQACAAGDHPTQLGSV